MLTPLIPFGASLECHSLVVIICFYSKSTLQSADHKSFLYPGAIDSQHLSRFVAKIDKKDAKNHSVKMHSSFLYPGAIGLRHSSRCHSLRFVVKINKKDAKIDTKNRKKSLSQNAFIFTLPWSYRLASRDRKSKKRRKKSLSQNAIIFTLP